MGNKRSGQVRTTASSGVNKTYIIVGAVIAAFVAGFIALVVIDSRQQAASSPPGEVETYDVGPAGQHTQSDVNYEQTPPAGGEHNPVWQNEGYYDAPVRDENAVHTLEHGAVWITFDPELPQDQRDIIQELVEGQDCMLASPYPDLPGGSPIVASAWGAQTQLESADDPNLERFIQSYRKGAQTPEPGATCAGGTNEPAA